MSDKKVTHERIQHLLSTSTAHYNRLYGKLLFVRLYYRMGSHWLLVNQLV